MKKRFNDKNILRAEEGKENHPSLRSMIKDEPLSPNSIEPTSCTHRDRKYDEGEQWPNPSDSCETCMCHRGQVRCDNEICLHLNCSQGEVHLPGQCCPVCKEALAQQFGGPNNTCMLNNRKYFPGSRWNPYLPPAGFNKCMVCKCGPQSIIECEQKKCPPLTCSQSVSVRDSNSCCPRCPPGFLSTLDRAFHRPLVPQHDQAFDDPIAAQQLKDTELLKAGGCKIRNQIYENGEQWHPSVASFGENKCLVCKCKDSVRKCSNVICKPQHGCKNLVTRSSECCPVCMDDDHSSSRKSAKKV